MHFFTIHRLYLLVLLFSFQTFSLSAQTEDYSSQSIEELNKAFQTAAQVDDYPVQRRIAGTMLEKARAANWEFMQILSLSRLSDVVEEMADYSEADSLNQLLLSVARDTLKEQPNDILFAYLYRQYGRYCSRTGQLDKAEEALKKSIAIFKVNEQKDRRYAGTVHDLGTVYLKQNRYEEAAFYLLEAKDLRKELLGEKHKSYGTSLNNLAIVYARQKDYGRAEEYYQKSLAIRREALGADHHRYLLTRSNLGSFYFDRGKYELAFELIDPVVDDMGRRSGDFQRYYHGLLASRGRLHIKLGRSEAGLKDLQTSKALGFRLFENMTPGLLTPIHLLAETYIDQKRWQAAEAELLLAIRCNLQDSTELKNLSTKALARLPELDVYFVNATLEQLELLGTLYEKWSAERPDLKEKAYTVYKIALQVAERRRNELGETGDKLELLANNANLVDRAVSFQLDWHSEPHAHWEELFSIVEYNKSILLADAMKNQRAQSLLPDELADREQALQKAISEEDKRINEAKTPEEQKTARQKRNDLKLRLVELRQEIEAKFPRYYQLKYANITAKVDEVQQLLPKKTALLEYFVGEEMSYLFWLEKDYFHIHPLPISRDSLSNQVERLRKTLSDYVYIQSEPQKSGQLYREMAYWFYENLVAPGLKGREGLKRLMVVTDGQLGHLPFEVFLTQPTPEAMSYAELPYLLKDYRISYNYSATLFKENAEEPVKEGNYELLAMAASYEGNGSKAADLRSAYYRSLRNVLQPLPAAQQEVEALSMNFEGLGLLGSAASERAFKERATNYSLLHLAMHSVANQAQPSLSSLVFTEDGDTLEDNFLQAYEIAQMQLKAQLVVLSACETGFGKFQQGEGVMSLARSFMYAGVPSVVVSLWQVSDESTSLIMQHFYDALFEGHRKDDALREAKLRYLETAKGLQAHPAYWGAFIQIGDSRPMDLSSQRMTWWSIAALGAGLFLVGFLLLRRFRKKAE